MADNTTTSDHFTEGARLAIWNDGDTYNALRAMAQDAASEEDAADMLRQWVEEGNPLDDSDASPLYTDLMTRAIEQIDYRALAERLRRS